MNQIKGYIKLIEDWKTKVLETLFTRFQETEVIAMLEAYKKTPRTFHETFHKRGVPQSYCNLIAGLSAICEIQELILSPPYPEKISSNLAAQIAFLSFNAGLLIGMFPPGRGVELLEPYAEKGKSFDRKNKPGVTGTRSQLREAITHIFKQCIAEGNTAPLLPGRFQASLDKSHNSFLQTLKVATKNDSVVKNLIKSVSTTKIIPTKDPAKSFKTAQNILTELRNLPENKKYFNI